MVAQITHPRGPRAVQSNKQPPKTKCATHPEFGEVERRAARHLIDGSLGAAVPVQEEPRGDEMDVATPQKKKEKRHTTATTNSFRIEKGARTLGYPPPPNPPKKNPPGASSDSRGGAGKALLAIHRRDVDDGGARAFLEVRDREGHHLERRLSRS